MLLGTYKRLTFSGNWDKTEGVWAVWPALLFDTNEPAIAIAWLCGAIEVTW